MDTRGQCGDSGCSAAIYTNGYTWPVGDIGCSTGDTHMDTRGQWVTLTAVLAMHIWIHVASGVTVAVVLPIHIWIHVAIG